MPLILCVCTTSLNCSSVDSVASANVVPVVQRTMANAANGGGYCTGVVSDESSEEGGGARVVGGA